MSVDTKGLRGMKFANSWVELLGGLLLVVASIYGVLEYSQHKAGLQVEQMERLHDEFDSAPMLERRARAATQPGKFGKDAYEMFIFFEKVARWEEKGLIDIEDVDYYFRDAFQLYWYVWEPAVLEYRRSQQDPSLYEGVQRVVTRLQSELDVKPPNDAQLNDLLKFEQKRAAEYFKKPEVEEIAAPPESQQTPERSQESQTQGGKG